MMRIRVRARENTWKIRRGEAARDGGRDIRRNVATLSATNVMDNARFIMKFGDGETTDYYSPRVVIFH